MYDPYGNCAVYNADWSATVAWADLVYLARGIVTAPRRMRACVGHAAPLSWGSSSPSLSNRRSVRCTTP